MADSKSTISQAAPPPNPTSQSNDAMDKELDPEIDMALDPAPPDPENPEIEATLPEPREPTKKDISLRDFLSKMDDYAPIVRLPPSLPPPLKHLLRFFSTPYTPQSKPQPKPYTFLYRSPTQ